jgi:hypothetical protein
VKISLTFSHSAGVGTLGLSQSGRVGAKIGCTILVRLVLNASWHIFMMGERREGRSESIVLYWYEIIIPAAPWELSHFIVVLMTLQPDIWGHNDRVSCTLHLIALSCVILVLMNLLAIQKTCADVVAHPAGQAAAGLETRFLIGATEVLCSGVCLGLIQPRPPIGVTKVLCRANPNLE